MRARLLATAAFVLVTGETASAQDATQLDEITVTSPSPIAPEDRRPGPLKDQNGTLPVVTGAFAPVTVVPRNEIARNQPATLGDALDDKPGVSGTTFAPGGANRPIIRGLDGPRIRIQENGLGVHDVSALGEDHAVPINPLVADQLEVIRGPATLRYGSAAIGGVVSAVNNRVPQFEPPNFYAADALVGYSSVDNGRTAAATVDAGRDGFAFHADGFATKTQSDDTPAGKQANSATDSQGGAVGFSRIYDQGYVGLSYSRYEGFYRIPGEETAERNVRLDPIQDKLQLQGEHRFEGGPITAVRYWLNGADYRHDEIALGEDDGIDGVQATFKNREGEGRIELQHAPIKASFGQFRGSFGVQGGVGKLKTSGEAGGLIAPTESRNVAAYLFEEFDFGGGLRLQGAGRIERATVDGTATTFPGLLPDGTEPTERDAKKTFTPVSVSLGALQALPYGFEASLTGQYVERAPSNLELFSRGGHDAPELFEIGDPNLKMERATSIEAGLRRAEGPIRVDASAYYTRFHDFIYRRLTGIQCGGDFDSCGVEDELDQVLYSQQNARFYGAELALQYDALTLSRSVIGVDGQYDFVRATFTDGTNVPRIPPHRLGGGVFWRSEDGFFARVGLLHAFAQNKTAALETRTPGYDNLKAEFSYTRAFDRATARLSSITVGVVGDNLLDERIRNAASFKKDQILLPGAGVRAFVRAKF